jgi:hypothetical protein
MMDGIVNQLRSALLSTSGVLGLIHFQYSEAQEKGIWAWDCVTEEPVLVIPMILVLLGNDPMQSEFACHIGLGGKFFCRACWVKGSDAAAESAEDRETRVSDNESAIGSEATSDGGSDGQSTSGKKLKGWRKRALESMAQMVDCMKSFMKVRNILHFVTSWC